MKKRRRFPIPPGVAGKVIQSASNPDTSVGDLAGLIEKDAVLSAQILKAVNSAHYALSRKVAQVSRAISFMGIRAVRNLVLSLGIRDLVPATSTGGFKVNLFWQSSLRRAATGRSLAKELGLAQADESFTLGLCQDLGLLIRIQEEADLANKFAEVFDRSADERLAFETETGDTHVEIGYSMFAEWNFPDELAIPIRFHHNPNDAPEEHRKRAQIAYASEAIADLLLMKDKAAALQTAGDRLEELGLERDRLGDLLDEVSSQVDEFAELLGLNKPDQMDYGEIVMLATEGLVNLNLSYEQMTQRLESTITEQKQTTEKLKEVTEQLREQASTDELTGLPNRRSFDEALARELTQAQRQESAVSLVMIDVDHFKKFNDTHGHQAGDKVLQQVGEALQATVRACDTAARYGGEEFAAILPFTDPKGGDLAANRLREAIAGRKVEWEGEILSVTASLGGATVSAAELGNWKKGPEVVQAEMKKLIERADSQLYKSKEAGRNCVTWAKPSS